jgi:hypothetical protein
MRTSAKRDDDNNNDGGDIYNTYIEEIKNAQAHKIVVGKLERKKP